MRGYFIVAVAKTPRYKGLGSLCGWGPPEKWKHCIIQWLLQQTRNQNFPQRALQEGRPGL